MHLNIFIKATAIARVVAPVVTTTTALTFCLVSAVSAQVATESRSPQSTTEQSVQFKSSFSGYVPYSEQSIESWREANDRVGEIGGWRVYAKEAQQTRSQAKPDTQMLQAPMSHAHPQTKEGKE